LRLNRAVKHLKELLQQLVGAQDYAFYFADGKELALIARTGAAAAPLRVHPGETDPKGAAGAIELAFLTGKPRIVEGSLAKCSMSAPAAVVPMRFDDQIVGVIVVFTVFPQKQNFVAVDFELFKMLSAHAATALAGALLFFSTDGKLPGLEPFAQIAE
jgi:GAF domain-containing protein